MGYDHNNYKYKHSPYPLKFDDRHVHDWVGDDGGILYPYVY